MYEKSVNTDMSTKLQSVYHLCDPSSRSKWMQPVQTNCYVRYMVLTSDIQANQKPADLEHSASF